MIVFLFVDRIYAVPLDGMEMEDTTEEAMTMETTTTTTTTTTTLPPEIDREWEDLVLAAPAVVNYLGLFMASISRQDESLVVPYTYTVRHLNAPLSLHTALSQLASLMETTLKSAHGDLVRVQGSMSQIPEHLKASLLLIKTAPDELLNQLLPYTLRNVNRAAKEGSTVTKPTVDQFVSISLMLEELMILLNSTLAAAPSKLHLLEVNIYGKDVKTQWDLLVKLFRKFSDRADAVQKNIDDHFVAPIDEAQKSNDFNSQSKRSAHLDQLIPNAIIVDQFSSSLDMMITTFMDITNDYNVTTVTSIKQYLSMKLEPERLEIQQELWENIVLQSIKIARLAQNRQNQFVNTGSNRQMEYGTYSQKVVAG